MKVNIDEAVFNKAITSGKLELAEWLLDNNCPVNESSYIQNFNIDILKWLKKKEIIISRECLSDVIEKTGDYDVIKWFIDNSVSVDDNSLVSCIRNNRNELLWKLLEYSKKQLGASAFKAAIIAENIEVLDFLKDNGCKPDEVIVEIAMKHKKKNSLKWLVVNDLF